MTTQALGHGDRFAAHSLQALADSGIELTVGHDFETYRELLREARPDHILGDPFEPRLHQMDASNALWIVGRNAKGQLMHTQAMRMIDTYGMGLADYLRNNFRAFPPSGVDLDLHRSRYRAGPGGASIEGSVCYHGEYWIGQTPREFRGTGLSSILGRYAFWEARRRWDPDYVFAFMQKSVVFKGFAARHAYMHVEPGALRWFLRGQDTPIEGYMAYMGRAEMRFVLDMPLSDFIATERAA
ncbi:MAG: hypothetical protein ACSHWZ_16725 [Sulfitobacter sp.]